MSEIPLDSSGRIDTDVNCVGCDYNLRGLDGEAVCPECGVLVERSVRGDLLQFANAGWVSGLASAMDWALGSLVLAVIAVGVIDSFSISVIAPPGAGTVIGGRSVQNPWGMIAGILILGVPVVCAWRACWLFSMPEPDSVAPTLSPDWRLIARRSVVFGLWMLVLMSVCATGLRLLPIGDTTLEIIVGASAAVGLVTAVICCHAAGRIAAGLAKRIPDKQLTSHTKFVTAGGTIVGSFMCVGFFLIVFWPRVENLFSISGQPGPLLLSFVRITLGMGGLATMIGGLVFGLGLLILMFRFRNVLHEVAKSARSLRSIGEVETSEKTRTAE